MRGTWSKAAAPPRCQLCNEPFEEEFIDGKTYTGPWAYMCRTCHEAHGVGFGVGRGQLYILIDTEYVQEGDI